jgi:hypothetical protein
MNVATQRVKILHPRCLASEPVAVASSVGLGHVVPKRQMMSSKNSASEIARLQNIDMNIEAALIFRQTTNQLSLAKTPSSSSLI